MSRIFRTRPSDIDSDTRHALDALAAVKPAYDPIDPYDPTEHRKKTKT